MTLATSSDSSDSVDDVLSSVSSQLDLDYQKHKLLGLPRPVFIIMIASLILSLLIASLCIYNFVISKRQSRYAGFSKIGTRAQNGSLFDDDEEDNELWRDSVGAKSYKAQYSKKRLIKDDADNSSSEDELYNVRVYTDSRNQVT